MILSEIKKEAFKIGIRDFYDLARSHYLNERGFETDNVEDRDLERLLDESASVLKVDKEELWGNTKFHMAFRVTSLDELASLGDDYDLDKVKACLDEGRNMSILPLNVLLGGDTMKRFVPTLPGLFSGEQKHSLDPYGIFNNHIEAIVDGERIYLGSRKFGYAVLANVTEFCPIGCAECYKGILTRMGMAALSDVSPEYAELRRQLNLQEEMAVERSRLLTQWLNKNPEVNTLIFSGGEPFMYSPETIGRMLSEVSEAEHLKVVRFCTGSVYLGLFSTITDDLIGKMSEFMEQNDGLHGRRRKQLYFNCDVADEHQILAPEARLASERLQKAGISLHLQMPLQEGINFYRDDAVKTGEKLKKISEAAYSMGVVPYKAIVDMHSPSHAELTVPIEVLSKAVGVFEGHFDNSDMMRWQAYCVLHGQGNFYIYPNMDFQKEVDMGMGRVTYFIPKSGPDGGVDEVHTYEEPLLKGINDCRSLRPIGDANVIERIDEVRDGYHRLRKDEINMKEFCRVSGIELSENKPLVVE